MANPLGRISGQLLKDDLTRTSDLEFDRVGAAEPLLHLNVGSRLVGVNTDAAGVPLEVNGTLTTTNLIVDQVSNSVKLGTQVRVTGDILVSNTDNLNLVASTHVFADNIRTSNLDFNNNVISSRIGNSPIELSPSGSGTVDIHSNLNISNSYSLYASGDITLGGNITLGNSDTDNVIFNADINSNINPNISDLYSLGSDPSIIGNKRWEGIYPELVNGEVISASTIGGGSINLALRPGNIWFVAKEGNDTNVGDHENGAFLTIEHALTNIDLQAGDTVLIYPGNYTEITPLTIPVGVTVKGISLRTVNIVPDVTTQYEDVFLLNGETTVSNITVKDFYYDSIADTGYAFRFAPGFKVTSRSPYIQNVSVITSETTLGALDAGRGALVDGAVVDPTSNEASILFHSMTMITPNANALTMTNGVRVEWVNCFTYFANIGLHALAGTSGFGGPSNFAVGGYDVITGFWGQSGIVLTGAGSKQITVNVSSVGVVTIVSVDAGAEPGIYISSGGTRWIFVTGKLGAELRSIGSATVYGNYGAVSNGQDTLMYLINHNFAYIGAGLDSNNDPSLNIVDNETVELAAGKIYYQSLDNAGNFSVGDAFSVSYETGIVSFNGLSVTAGGISSINFTGTGTNTRLNSQKVSSTNIQFSGHTLSSYVGPVNLLSNTNELNVPHDVAAAQDVEVVGDFSVEGQLILGNQLVDIVEFGADLEFDLRPETTSTYNLGSSLKQWLVTDIVELDIGTSLKISGNTIETLVPGTDLKLIASGSGKLLVPSDNVLFNNDLTVDTDTNLKNTVIGTGGLTPVPKTLDLTGDYLQTGNTLQTGNRSISLTLDVDSNAYFDSISFVNNTIATTDADTDLSLKAAGSGQVNFNDNVTFSLAAEITTVVANGITNSGTITSDIFTDSNIEIYDNTIRTTFTDSDLRLLASGSGIISLPLDPMLIDNDLIVSDSSILKNTALTNLLHSGNTLLTGGVNQTGDLDISNNLTVTGTDAFFTDIRIVNNTVFTTATNSDLRLVAAGSGIIDINDNATFSQNLRVNGTVYTNGVTNSGTITSDIFTNNDIEINDNYITTTVGNNNLILLGVSTGGPKLEKIKFNTTTISTETTNEGITLTVPSGSVSISASTALKIPAGTTLNRPTLAQGEFRFNSTDTLFRGYSTATVSFAGVYSANKLTNVLAHPTNNTLRFTTNSATNMTIGSGGLTVNSMSVDNNLTFATNIISTATTNADLYLTPNGNGEVIMDDISLYSNEITNLNSTNALTIQNTGSGYVKFSGTGGLAIPAGPTVIDTSGVDVGDLRYNTTLSITEVFNGVDYVGLSAASATLTGPEVEEITNLWALVLG